MPTPVPFRCAPRRVPIHFSLACALSLVVCVERLLLAFLLAQSSFLLLLPGGGLLLDVVQPGHLVDRVLQADRVIREDVSDAAGCTVLVVAARGVEPKDVRVRVAERAVGLDQLTGRERVLLAGTRHMNPRAWHVVTIPIGTGVLRLEALAGTRDLVADSHTADHLAVEGDEVDPHHLRRIGRHADAILDILLLRCAATGVLGDGLSGTHLRRPGRRHLGFAITARIAEQERGDGQHDGGHQGCAFLLHLTSCEEKDGICPHA